MEHSELVRVSLSDTVTIDESIYAIVKPNVKSYETAGDQVCKSRYNRVSIPQVAID